MKTGTFDTPPGGPLLGTRVLDLSRLVAGNMLTHILADFGGEVVKIERPGKGGDLRNWRVRDVSLFWKVYARNKKSLTLDLQSEEGRTILLRLVGSADILVESFVPGTLERWGLGPDVLHARNKRLVIIRISGWGQTGLYRDRPGFGSLVEGMSGFAASNGYADRPPVLPPLALADMVAGYSGACATVMALREAERSGAERGGAGRSGAERGGAGRSGAGQVVDLSLFDPLFAALGPAAAEHRMTGEASPRLGSRSMLSCPRNVYRCRDGKHVALSASVQAVAERLLHAIGRPDLIDDPRFATNEARVQNDDVLDPVIADFIAAMTRGEALAHFTAADVTVGPVLDISELVDHPYLVDREVLAEYPDDEIGALLMHHVSPQLSATPGVIHSPAPALGQHTAEILAWVGLDGVAVERLRQDRVI